MHRHEKQLLMTGYFQAYLLPHKGLQVEALGAAHV
jgi:hypothetical protein